MSHLIILHNNEQGCFTIPFQFFFYCQNNLIRHSVDNMNDKSNTPLLSLPYWHGGLPRCDAAAAGYEIGAGLKALPGELQTHEAELHLAAWTKDVLATGLVVLHL